MAFRDWHLSRSFSVRSLLSDRFRRRMPRSRLIYKEGRMSY